MADIGRIERGTPLEMYECDIYSGKHIITSIQVQARSVTEAIELAAGALKIKPRKLYIKDNE